jgi:hypothetical protein
MGGLGVATISGRVEAALGVSAAGSRWRLSLVRRTEGQSRKDSCTSSPLGGGCATLVFAPGLENEKSCIRVFGALATGSALAIGTRGASCRGSPPSLYVVRSWRDVHTYLLVHEILQGRISYWLMTLLTSSRRTTAVFHTRATRTTQICADKWKEKGRITCDQGA